MGTLFSRKGQNPMSTKSEKFCQREEKLLYEFTLPKQHTRQPPKFSKKIRKHAHISHKQTDNDLKQISAKVIKYSKEIEKLSTELKAKQVPLTTPSNALPIISEYASYQRMESIRKLVISAVAGLRTQLDQLLSFNRSIAMGHEKTMECLIRSTAFSDIEIEEILTPVSNKLRDVQRAINEARQAVEEGEKLYAECWLQSE